MKTLVILTVMVVGVVQLGTANSITFLRHPETQHLLVNESTRFYCVVQYARDVSWYWYEADGNFSRELSEQMTNVISITILQLPENTKNSTIIIRSVQTWNNTMLRCFAEQGASHSFSEASSLNIYFSLRPLPPSHLQSAFTNRSKIVISWSPNLLWDTYPISYYNITVVEKGARNSAFLLISTTVQVQSNIHEFILSDHFSSPACADYSFSIASVSDLHGESDYAVINGTVGSDLKGDSSNLNLTTNVYFYSNGTPFLNTEIELPRSVCLDDVLILNYMASMISSNATNTSVTSGIITHHGADNIKLSIMSGLEKDQNYTLEVIVTSKNGGSQASTSVNFNTIFTPIIPQTCSYDSEKENEFGVVYYKTVIGVCSAFALTILVVLVAVVTYVCIQREKHKRETKLNTSANKICESMVQNPIYDGPVYESVQRQFDNLTTTTERTASGEGNTLSDRPCNSKVSCPNSSEKSVRYVDQPVQISSKNFRSMSFRSGSPPLSTSTGSNPRSTSVSIPFTSKKTGKERNKLHLTLTLTENDLNAAAESYDNQKPVIRSTNPVALMDVDKNYMVMSPISVLSDSPNAVLEWSPEDTQKYKE